MITPTEFRNFYNEWKKTAPANDSDIIPDEPKESVSPRHAELFDKLSPLLTWKESYESTDPLQTNYLQDPNDEFIDDEDHDDDKNSEGVKRDVERLMNDGPSAEQMMKAVEGIAFKTVYDNIVCQTDYAWFTYRRERLVPDLDAAQNHEPVIAYWYKQQKLLRPRVTLGIPYDSTLFKIKLASAVRFNHLKLSDTDQDERKPLGSITSWGWYDDANKAKNAKQRGGDTFNPPPPVQILNPEELLIARQERIVANDNLDPKHAAVLDAAIVAPNFETVGCQFGYTGKTAERQGKRLTIAAAQAFSDLKQQHAA